MPQAFTLIQSLNTNSGAASAFNFTSIPNTYTDLYMTFTMQATSSSPQSVLQVTFSGGAGYITQKLGGQAGTTPGASGNSGLSALYQGNINASTGSTFGYADWYIPNYSGSTRKSYYGTASGVGNGQTVYINWVSGHSTGTSAISSITITNEYGNWAQYCTANLYGITKA
jgi:hypothetical protein